MPLEPELLGPLTPRFREEFGPGRSMLIHKEPGGRGGRQPDVLVVCADQGYAPPPASTSPASSPLQRLPFLQVSYDDPRPGTDIEDLLASNVAIQIRELPPREIEGMVSSAPPAVDPLRHVSYRLPLARIFSVSSSRLLISFASTHL